MARKKKETSTVSQPKTEITAEQVYDVLKFANSAYGMYNGAFAPDLVNARLKDITMSPQMATADKI